MSFYDPDSTWSAPARQPSWETPAPPSRSNTASSISHISEPNAFASQFEEIERATDNLVRSGKWFPGAIQPLSALPIRRDSIPSVNRGFEFGGGGDPRMGGGGAGPSSRHQSMSEYDGGRPGSAGLQGYYQGQRFPGAGGRQSEAEQMAQAKRRMAAQRERELRNYHQEQQYNRTVSGGKSDRSMSPNTMSEDARRELIARQHAALYGDNASLYGSEGSSSSRPQSQHIRGPNRGASPLAFDAQQQQNPDPASATDAPRNTTASPQPQQQAYNTTLLPDQPSHRTSNSSPTESPPPGVAPIGTRPTAQQQSSTSAAATNKRSTTPLTPSSLSYGFSAEPSTTATTSAVAATQGSKDERSTSAASNPSSQQQQGEKSVGGLGGWGGGNGWGNGKGGLVQGSVWG